MILVALIGLLTPFNHWARANWQLFSRDNYFDNSGLFLVVVVAAPLLLLAVIILVRYFTCECSEVG